MAETLTATKFEEAEAQVFDLQSFLKPDSTALPVLYGSTKEEEASPTTSMALAVIESASPPATTTHILSDVVIVDVVSLLPEIPEPATKVKPLTLVRPVKARPKTVPETDRRDWSQFRRRVGVSLLAVALLVAGAVVNWSLRGDTVVTPAPTETPAAVVQDAPSAVSSEAATSVVGEPAADAAQSQATGSAPAGEPQADPASAPQGNPATQAGPASPVPPANAGGGGTVAQPPIAQPPPPNNPPPPTSPPPTSPPPSGGNGGGGSIAGGGTKATGNPDAGHGQTGQAPDGAGGIDGSTNIGGFGD